MNKRTKGFTLIEMLVVIAIIAVLVSVVIPVISNSTTRAKATADSANLRIVLGLLNADVVNGDKTVQEILDASQNPTSQLDPDATLWVVYDYPAFIDVYYVKGDAASSSSTFYGLDYLVDIATNGTSTLSTGKPNVEGTWYAVDND